MGSVRTRGETMSNGVVMARKIDQVIIHEMKSPISVRTDGTFGAASLRDAVAGQVYRFEIYVRYGGPCDLLLLRYYAATREDADAAAEKIRAGEV